MSQKWNMLAVLRERWQHFLPSEWDSTGPSYLTTEPVWRASMQEGKR